ncbi:hypothetical protein [Nonomuraea helvata]|uniref:Uncharacterized protein n=1 Tax=Nonomuraea helvata TaxID=37484 RepID=A0ABV5RTM4_9ACTN
MLTHGWPSSFLELAPLARRLSMPSRHSGQAADAFTVVDVPTAVAVFPGTLATRRGAGPSGPSTSPDTPPCHAAAASPRTRKRRCSPPTSPSSSAHCGRPPDLAPAATGCWVETAIFSASRC